MDNPPTDKPDNLDQRRAALARDHLANERTFLSWLRFSIAIAAFGFVVSRFGLFVAEMLTTTQAGQRISGLSVPLGIVFVVVGPILAIFAALRFFAVERELDAGSFGRHYTMLYVVLGGIIIGGLVVTGYLIYDWVILGK